MTALSELTDDQVRAVRDDRMAIGDGLFKILMTPVDSVDLRILVNSYITTLTASAMNESIKRIDARINHPDKDHRD